MEEGGRCRTRDIYFFTRRGNATERPEEPFAADMCVSTVAPRLGVGVGVGVDDSFTLSPRYCFLAISLNVFPFQMGISTTTLYWTARIHAGIGSYIRTN